MNTCLINSGFFSEFDPDFREQGIARGLLDLVLIESYELGAQKAMLEVRASNHAAQALYLQYGFKTVHRRRRYYVDNAEDALLMNLEEIDDWIKTAAHINLQRTAT